MNRKHSRAPLGLCALVAVVCAGLGGGCAGGGAKASGEDPAAIDGRGFVILRGENGARATWEELVSAAAGADAVLVGEEHGHAGGQAFQAAFFADVLAKSPSAAGALEFFERDEQMGVDDYLSGVTDEKAFRTATKRTDSNYPFGHRAIVEACRGAKRPMIAANAPRRYVRLARTEGYERLCSLTPEQQRLFAIPTSLPQPGNRYRDDFTRIMGPGGLDEDDDRDSATPPALPELTDEQRTRIDNGFRSQSLWDATMADSVGRSVAAGNRPTVLIVGKFHVDFAAIGGAGLYQALARGSQSAAAVPSGRIVTVSLSGQNENELKPADRRRADFVIYTGASPNRE